MDYIFGGMEIMGLKRPISLKNEFHVYRKNLGFTQSDVAKELGIALSTYQQKESGIAEFDLSEAKKLATMTDLTLDQLYQKLSNWDLGG